MENNNSADKIPMSIVYCVKDGSGQVKYQNEACLQQCGNKQNTVCSGGCMVHHKKVPEALQPLGIHVTSNVPLGAKNFDIALVTTPSQILTIALPLQVDDTARKEELLKRGLTEREVEIALLVIEGCSNRQIAKRLHIAHSTVKKHLYSIYGKIPRTNLLRR